MDKNITKNTVTVVRQKPPENYYSRNLSYITIITYVGMMAVIFLAFGYIRKKR
jgi:hypothetical protein